MRPILFLAAALLMLGWAEGQNRPVKWATIEKIACPAGAGSGEPNLFTSRDGRVYLSWIEALDESGHSLRFSVRDDTV